MEETIFFSSIFTLEILATSEPVEIKIFLAPTISSFTSTLPAVIIFAAPFLYSTLFFFYRAETPFVSLLIEFSLLNIILSKSKLIFPFINIP